MPFANVAPVFDSTPVTAAAVGQAYQYRIAAHDPNGGPVSYVLDSGPSSMSVDSVTGLLSWTPRPGDAAQVPVALVAYNVRGGHATQKFTIAVSGVNQPPVFDTLASQFKGQEGQALQIAVHATDADGGALTYGADQLPAGASFDASTQLLTWIPSS